MKQKILFLFSLCFVFTLFSCRKEYKTINRNEPVTLKVWCWDENFNILAMKEACKIYQQFYPKFSLEIENVPWGNIEKKLEKTLKESPENLPDIILIQDNALQKIIQSRPKIFLPIGNKIDLSQFADFKVSYGNIFGKNYSIPFDNGATATFLRRDIIEQAGLEVKDFNNITWGRFIELGKIVKEKTGINMLSYVKSESNCIMIMLQSCGVWMFDENGYPNIENNLVLQKSISLYKNMIEDEVCRIEPNWSSYIEGLQQGTVASCINGCWILSNLLECKDQEGLWAMVNTPKVDGFSNSVNYSNQGGSSWVILSNTKYPAVAIDFFNKTFASSLELYDTILPTSCAISTWLPAADSSVYEQKSSFFGGQKIFKEILAYSSRIPQVKYGVYNYEAGNAIIKAVNNVLKGDETLEEALQNAQKKMETYIK